MADDRPRGPRVKPTLDTAGDVSYAVRRRATARLELEELRRRAAELEELRRRAARAAELEAHMSDVRWAERWISDHGGTVPAALKATHPDTGGSAEAFALTQKAREILAKR